MLRINLVANNEDLKVLKAAIGQEETIDENATGIVLNVGQMFNDERDIEISVNVAGESKSSSDNVDVVDVEITEDPEENTDTESVEAVVEE